MLSFNRIREAIYEQSQQVQEFRRELNARYSDEGRGLEDIVTARCSHCGRATVALEHVHTPQRKLFTEEREQTWYSCEWCGAELDAETLNGRTPRKPASRAEPEIEWARRTA